MANSENIMGYDVYCKLLEDIQLTDKQSIINTLNAYSYVVARRDNDFKNVLKKSDILLADGSPVVLAAKVLKNKKIRKIAGADLFYHLLDLLQQTNGKCFFLGSSTQTLDLIKEKIKHLYPCISIECYSPPFKQHFSDNENEIMINAVNAFKPNVLFVGMTAPKQEKWVFENKSKIEAPMICSIGAVFDFFAGTVERPGKIWIKLGLEWFIRLVKEPKRLWKRYLIYSPRFFFDLLLFKLKIKT